MNMQTLSYFAWIFFFFFADGEMLIILRGFIFAVARYVMILAWGEKLAKLPNMC